MQGPNLFAHDTDGVVTFGIWGESRPDIWAGIAPEVRRGRRDEDEQRRESNEEERKEMNDAQRTGSEAVPSKQDPIISASERISSLDHMKTGDHRREGKEETGARAPKRDEGSRNSREKPRGK